MKKYLFFILFSCLFSFSGFSQIPNIKIDGYSNITTHVSKCIGDSVKLTCYVSNYPTQAIWYTSIDGVNYSPCSQGTNLDTIVVNITKYYKAKVGGNYSTSVTISKKLSPSKPMITSGDSIFCQTLDTLTYITKLDTNSITYSWTFPSGSNIVSGNTNDTIKVSSLTTGNIIIKGTNSCGVIGDSLVYHIYVETKANPFSISGPDNFCPGQSSIIYNIDEIPGYPTSYQWTLPSGCQYYNYSGNQITVNCSQNALSGYITVKPVNSCGVCDSSSLFITVNPSIPTPVITQSGNTLSSNATSGNQWYNNSTGLVVAISQTFSPTESGVYYVIVSNGTCSSLKSNLIDFTYGTSISEFNEIGMNVYPNPATNQLNIRIDQKLIGSAFSFTDFLGRKVITGQLTSENTVVELGNLSKGIYLLRIGENGQQTFKVVKE